VSSLCLRNRRACGKVSRKMTLIAFFFEAVSVSVGSRDKAPKAVEGALGA